MKNEHLATYLNDHLAGSAGALELLDRMIDHYEEQPIRQFCRQIRAEVSADQEELLKMMKSIDVREGSLRKAGAWVAEKFSRAKTHTRKRRDRRLRLGTGAGKLGSWHQRQRSPLARARVGSGGLAAVAAF